MNDRTLIQVKLQWSDESNGLPKSLFQVGDSVSIPTGMDQTLRPLAFPTTWGSQHLKPPYTFEF